MQVKLTLAERLAQTPTAVIGLPLSEDPYCKQCSRAEKYRPTL